MEKQILRKEISRTIEGNVEIINNKYFEKNVLTEKEIDVLNDYGGNIDDSYFMGIIYDTNDELCAITVTELLNELSDYFDEADEDDKESYQYGFLEEIKKKLAEWRGFVIQVGFE